MINPRISADWSTTKPIAAFSCTPRVQDVHTKAEVVHLTPGLLGLGVLFNCHAEEMYCEIYLESLQIGVQPSRLQHSLVHGVQEVHTIAEVVHLTPGLLVFGVLFNFYA